METMETSVIEVPAYVANEKLIRWVQEMADLCKPDRIYWCDGSKAEYDALCEHLVRAGTFIRLNQRSGPDATWLVLIQAM